MKRIYKKEHLELLCHFFKDYSNIDCSTLESEDYCSKLLTLMSCTDIRKLELYYQDLEDEELTKELKEIGFESEIPYSDKKILLKNCLKKELRSLIQQDTEILKHSKVFENEKHLNFSQVFVETAKYEKIIKKATKKSLNEIKLGRKTPLNIKNVVISQSGVPKTKAYVDVYDQTESGFQFSNINLPVLVEEPIKENAVTENEAKMIPENNKEKVNEEKLQETSEKLLKNGKIKTARKKRGYVRVKKISINDLMNDTTFIMRKKKFLELTPSGSIDYYKNDKFKLKSIDKFVNKLPPVTFASEIYRGFDLRKFVNKIIYRNNNISIPKSTSYKSIKDFRDKAKGDTYFFRRFLPKYLAKLLMKQDSYLTFSDAKMIAEEIRSVLKLPDIEYFYNIYFKSGDYYSNSFRKTK